MGRMVCGRSAERGFGDVKSSSSPAAWLAGGFAVKDIIWLENYI
jgi:hypothetical protein